VCVSDDLKPPGKITSKVSLLRVSGSFTLAAGLPAAGGKSDESAQMAMIETILSLHRRGWSNSCIARDLRVDRDAVSRHICQAQGKAKAAKVIAGSEAATEGSKAAKVIIAGKRRADKVANASTAGF
jgi:hypothetical protein